MAGRWGAANGGFAKCATVPVDIVVAEILAAECGLLHRVGDRADRCPKCQEAAVYAAKEGA